MSKKFKLGVIGNPIEHSLSPFIHSRFARQEKINLDYKAHKVDLEKFNSFVSDFFSDPLAKGLNITLPFKSEAASLDGNISSEAKQINAVNTISIKNRKYVLDSTDGTGFIEDLQSKKRSLKNKNVLLIGAGAAIESILYRIIFEKPRSISIKNRTIEKAIYLKDKYSNYGSINLMANFDKPYDVIINGSSAGLTGNFLNPGELNLSEKPYFYDLNYSLDETPFCNWALEYSENVYDGTGMLVNQAAQSFKKWFGVLPSVFEVIIELQDLKKWVNLFSL